MLFRSELLDGDKVGKGGEGGEREERAEEEEGADARSAKGDLASGEHERCEDSLESADGEVDLIVEAAYKKADADGDDIVHDLRT